MVVGFEVAMRNGARMIGVGFVDVLRRDHSRHSKPRYQGQASDPTPERSHTAPIMVSLERHVNRAAGSYRSRTRSERDHCTWLPLIVGLAGVGDLVLARRALTPIDHLAADGPPDYREAAARTPTRRLPAPPGTTVFTDAIDPQRCVAARNVGSSIAWECFSMATPPSRFDPDVCGFCGERVGGSARGSPAASQSHGAWRVPWLGNVGSPPRRTR